MGWKTDWQRPVRPELQCDHFRSGRQGCEFNRLAFSFSFRATGNRMFLAVATVAAREVAIAVAGVLPATKTLSGGVGSIAFAFPFQVGQGIVLCPHEASGMVSFPFASSFTFSLLVGFEVAPEPSDRAAGKTAPSPSCTTILHVDVFGGLFLTHLVDAMDFRYQFGAGV